MSLFHERFRQLKEERNITLKELSEDLHISAPNLSYYMKGREPNFETLISIADYFNVTTDWLIGRTNERNENYSSIINEIQKEVSVSLNAENQKFFDQCQMQLFDISKNLYQFFANNDLNTCELMNSYFIFIFLGCQHYFKSLNDLPDNIEGTDLLSLIHAGELSTDLINPVILLSMSDYVQNLCDSEKCSMLIDKISSYLKNNAERLNSKYSKDTLVALASLML